MPEKYLTLAQNTCAARIFLNAFGLTLENVDNIDEFSKIKIFDKYMNVVGELHFDNGKVMIAAKYNNNLLEANYNISKVSGFIDVECGNALFGQWSSKIEFNAENNNGIKISGEFLIGCSVDSEFGIKCLCHPLIKCEVPYKGKITLKILRDGETFGLNIQSGDCYEEICIMPWDNLNGFIRHDIISGEYDNDIHEYPYRMYAGIFNGGSSEEYRDKLHVFLNENRGKDILAFNNEWVPKVSKRTSEGLIQKGLLMQKLDPKMCERISQLRQLLFGEVSLLDNLFAICYDSYSDEELESLLGIKRIRMTYQNGAKTLEESYFGIGQDSQFLSTEQQKRLSKSYRSNM